MYSLYTDGSCLGNPGTGGWAAVLIKEGAESPLFQCCGGESGTTNNIMELIAVIEGLIKYKSFNLTGLEVYTDSQYVKNGISEWIHKWKVNNWKTVSGSDVKNVNLWKRLDKLVEECPGVRFKWVKAHRGDRWNEHVDDLARKTAQLIKYS